MFQPRRLLDPAQLVECPPGLISLEDDVYLSQTEETKLIDDREGTCPSLSESTLAEMMSLDGSLITSFHEDLSSVISHPDRASLATIQSSGPLSTTIQNFAANQLAVSHRTRGQLDISTPCTSTSTPAYVNSPADLRLSANSSQMSKRLNQKDSCPANNQSSSVHTLAVRNREVEVQTTHAVPAVSSEGTAQLQTPLSESIIPTHLSGIKLAETMIPLSQGSTSTTVAFQSLTASLAGSDSVTNTFPSMAPSVGSSTADNASPRPKDSPTALRTRTTEDVIADLKRPIGFSLRLQASTEGSSSLSLADKHSSSVHNSTRYKGQSEDPVHEFDEEDDDDEDEIGPLTKTKKFSERRRRMNAIADQYIQTSLETTIKKDIEKGYADDELQSTRWIVNKSENREIISSPREYQTELFERAKEKNIIAVLDTGMSPNGVEL